MSDSPSAPKVYVISGPSGAGKDSVITGLLAQISIDTVVTMTTRRPRANEIDGIHYRFVTVETFETMRDSGDLLESAFVHGNWYGVPFDSVRQSLALGHDVLIKVDPQGARSIKQLLPEAIFIFIQPSSLAELHERLAIRQSETEAEMALRLRNAEQEMTEQIWFDYIVTNANGQIDRAIAAVVAIITRRARHAA